MLGALEEAGAATPESEFDAFVCGRRSVLVVDAEVLVALLDDALHVGTGGTYDPASYLEPVLVFNLDVEAAGVLYVLLLLVELEDLLFLRTW